jgi:hypothetical protein
LIGSLFFFLLFLFSQGQFAYPIVSLIGAFIPEVSSKIIYLLYAISTGLFGYIFITVNTHGMTKSNKYFLGEIITMSSVS